MDRTRTQKSWVGKLASGVVVATVVGSLGAIGAGCLSRPVSTLQPTTKVNFNSSVRQASVDKVDLLFMIDNSQSMGDKQEILQAAVPDLIQALVQPNCDDLTTGLVVGACTPDATGNNCTCATGSKIEFPPVHDMHIGIVSSSLGGRGSDACADTVMNPLNPSISTHNNDNGELINRSDPMNMQTEAPVADAAGSNFLAWYPPVTSNTGTPPAMAVTSSTQLVTDFTDLVTGVHQYGCGFEAQDEAWYRFLVQPDPYDHVSRDTGECAGMTATGQFSNSACLVGIDTTILQQRHDFLRPDSLLAVIVVSDENSGEVVDPLAVSGQAWAYMDSHFPGGPGTAAMGTTACGPTPVMGPNPGAVSANCTSCGFTNSAAVMADKTAGGNCSMNGGYYTVAADSLNTRGVYDQQRFGVDPRFPISRYVQGLSAFKVPDQKGEHGSGGAYCSSASVGGCAATNDCTNPVFAQNLPTDATANLCNLTKGSRTADLVFLAAITGVPHQLLQAQAGKDPECSPPNVMAGTAQADCPQKANLTGGVTGGTSTGPLSGDWQKILGKDPEGYDFTGIDPHMFVSIGPRAMLPPPSTPGNGTDPINGREWNTNQLDQQYACTFPLAMPRDCSTLTVACDCTMGHCDTCAGNASCSCPPLCGDGTTVPLTTQVLAKAYPSPRELEEVMALGAQGIVSSLCPIHTTALSATDPLYGYRPAVSAIVDRLKNALANQCLPETLEVDKTCGTVQCLILETLATGSQTDCGSTMYPGLSQPDPTVLASFNNVQHNNWIANGGLDAGLGPDPSTLPTCEVTQLVPSNIVTDPSCGTAGAAPNPQEQSLHYSVVSDFTSMTGCGAAAEAGWCYVTGTAAGGSCPQAILFSPGGNPQVGAQVNLECIVTAPTPGFGSDAAAGTSNDP